MEGGRREGKEGEGAWEAEMEGIISHDLHTHMHT